MTDIRHGQQPDTDLAANTLGQTLPTELIVIVAQFMAGDHAYASLARLNVVSHAIHEETLAIMYNTVVWNTNTRWWIRDKGYIPSGWKYIRYLVTTDMSSDALREYLQTISRQVIDGPIARDAILATLPRLTLEIIKQSHAEVFVRRSEDGCAIQVYQSMSASEFSAAVAIGQHLCRSTLSPAVSLPPPNPRPHLKPYGYRITSILFCEDSNITAAIPPTEVAKHDELDAAERLDVEWSDTNRHRMGEREEEMMDTLRHVLQPMRSERRPDDQPYEVRTGVYDIHSLELVTDSLPSLLKTHLLLRIELQQRLERSAVLQQVLSNLADHYAFELRRLGVLPPATEFLNVWAPIEPLDGEDRSLHYEVEGTLATFGTRAHAADENSRATRPGFELVIKTQAQELNGPDARTLLRRSFYPDGASSTQRQ